MSRHSIVAELTPPARHRTAVPACSTRPATWLSRPAPLRVDITVMRLGLLELTLMPARTVAARNSLCAAAKCAFSSARTRRPRETLRMVHDVELADRIRAVVQGEPGLAQRRMFGGVFFLSRATWPSVPVARAACCCIDRAEADSLISEPARAPPRDAWPEDCRLASGRRRGGRGRVRPARLGAARCHLRAFVAAQIASSRQGSHSMILAKPS
jgi:hypothetical protein